MEKFYLSIKDKTGEYKIYPVIKEVYTYVRQLEYAIKHPKKSKIKKTYKERFNLTNYDF